MITKKTVRRMANSQSYQRGEDLHRFGEVYDFQVEEYQDENDFLKASVSAWVEGSYNNSYQVTAEINETTSEVEEISCECPAFEKYSGICKHCVAVLLEYLDRRSDPEAAQLEADLSRLLSSLGVSKGFSEPAESGKQRIRKPHTDEGIKKLLSRYFVRDGAAFLPESHTGQVRVEPVLVCDYRQFRLKFRLGIDRMYVLKNVFRFVEDIDELRTVSYGKQLEFLHCMDAFTQESRPLVDFLCRKVRENPRYSYYGSMRYLLPANEKELELEGKTLDEFADLWGNRELSVEYPEGTVVAWMEEKLPDQSVTVEGGQDGIWLVPVLRRRIEGARYWYYPGGPGNPEICRIPLEDVREIQEFWEFLEKGFQKEYFIENEDVPAFCQTVLPRLEKVCQVERKDFLPETYLPPEAAFELYLDTPQRDMIACRVFGVYGEKKYNLYADAASGTAAAGRDLRREQMVKGVLRQYFHAYDPRTQSVALMGEEKVFGFLTEGLEQLRGLGEVFVSEKFKALKVTDSVKVQVGVRLEGHLLEMRLDSPQMSRAQLAEILSRYDRKKKYYRLKNGEFIRMDGDGIRVLQDLKDNLQLTDRMLKADTVTLPSYRALYLDARLKGEGLQVEKDRNFRHLIRDMKTIEENDAQVPPSLAGVLREYQKHGFRWLKTLCANGFGGILADDMGLGKTLQAIAFLLSEYEEQKPGQRKRALIICPASLVYNWKSELERFAPALEAVTVVGSAGERRQLLEEEQGDVLITSYDLLRRDVTWYEGHPFGCEIIDEAQYIKNQGTQTAHAVKAVQAEFRLALSGTPLENRLSELWSIFDYVMPGFLYGYQRFRSELELPIVKYQDENAMERLRKMISPFILRRCKQEVLRELPDKIEKKMTARLEGEQWELYQAHAQRLRMQLAGQTEEEFNTSRIQILSELTRLRLLCCDPALEYEDYRGGSAKLELCMDLVKNAVEGGHKILLFSQFTSMLSRIAHRLEKERIGYYLLTGSTPKERRVQMARSFNEDDTPVFCISLKAGGTGLNLTGADMVIHYDPWWNGAVENQATDRAHRIGQKQVVTVYRLIAGKTIEEKIAELQEQKRKLADQVLGGQEMGQTTFSKEELLELLDGSMDTRKA